MAQKDFYYDVNLQKENQLLNALLHQAATATIDAALTVEGQVGYDTTLDLIKYSNGATVTSVVTGASTHTFTNKTFDANGTGNSISNLEVADLASGVLDTDLSSVSASDDTLASAKAIKAYTDTQVSNITAGLAWKDDVVAATTAEITIASDLNVGDSIDGVTLADGDRVLVKNQTTNPEENGIYIAGVTPARSEDMNASAEFNAAIVPVQEGGTSNGGTTWRQTAVDPTVGTTAIAFVAFGADVPDASTTVKGIVELATTAETLARTDTVRAVVPSGLADFAVTSGGTSTDNTVVRYDGVSADIQGSGITIDDSDNLAGIVNLTATGTTTLNTGLTGVLRADSGVVSVDANSPTKYAQDITTVANVALTVTHNLATTDILVQVKNAAGELVEVEVDNYQTNSVDITTRPLISGGRVVIIG